MSILIRAQWMVNKQAEIDTTRWGGENSGMAHSRHASERLRSLRERGNFDPRQLALAMGVGRGLQTSEISN